MANINLIIDEFERFAVANGLGKSSQEATKALWLFCDESAHGLVILENENLENDLRNELRRNGWGISDGHIVSKGFSDKIGGILG